MNFVTKFFHAFNPSEPGYVFMWVLMLCAVICIAITLERLLFLSSRSGKDTNSFMKKIVDLIEKDNFDEAQKMCTKAGKMAMAHVAGKVLATASSGERRIRNLVDETVLTVIPELEKRTGYLATIGNVATLIGLMGTIYGLILSFASVGKPGIDAVEKSTLLASGIATAMNTTFLGLMVAIPAIVLYALFKSKTQQIIDEVDEHSLTMANKLIEKSYKTAKYNIHASQLKESVSMHVTGHKIQLYADNKLIKEINT
ncbi:MAG: MotA/TolQ/ExbB proton channel family protein [Proteobacteria bacterium]|nr:MotA/TolQ/ExbB proton channel family protein [Pseudomonadota bacterium]